MPEVNQGRYAASWRGFGWHSREDTLFFCLNPSIVQANEYQRDPDRDARIAVDIATQDTYLILAASN